MRKLIVLPMCIFASFQANAVVNGTALNWQNNDYAVRLDSKSLALNGQCTGTIIAGSYVLTAAHCLINQSDTDTIKTAYGHDINFDWSRRLIHGSFADQEYPPTEDVALIRLSNPVDHKEVRFIEDLDTLTLNKPDLISVIGFGGNHAIGRADFTYDKALLNRPENK